MNTSIQKVTPSSVEPEKLPALGRQRYGLIFQGYLTRQHGYIYILQPVLFQNKERVWRVFNPEIPVIMHFHALLRRDVKASQTRHLADAHGTEKLLLPPLLRSQLT